MDFYPGLNPSGITFITRPKSFIYKDFCPWRACSNARKSLISLKKFATSRIAIAGFADKVQKSGN
jgi:hypothetical protein